MFTISKTLLSNFMAIYEHNSDGNKAIKPITNNKAEVE
jgi:hypothetical protein